MATRLTTRKLETAKPGEELADTHTPGLRFYVTELGRRSFVYRYRSLVDGRLRQVALGRFGKSGLSLEQARARVMELREARRNGDDPQEYLRRERAAEATEAVPAATYTIEDLTRDYLRDRRSAWRASTEREISRMVDKLVLPRWRRVPASTLARLDIVQARDEIANRTPVLGNRFLWLMKNMLDYAVERERIPANPAASVRRRRQDREEPRERYLDADELKRLLTWFTDPANPLSEDVTDLLRFVLLIGCRLGEACGARLEEFDLESGRWTIPAGGGDRTTKSGRENRVYLSRQALALVKQRKKKAKHGYLWPSQKGATHRKVDAVGSVLRKAQVVRKARVSDSGQLDHWTPHDLRRSVASGMAALDVPRETISRVLGHAAQGVTARHYDHAKRDKQAAEAWQRWADYLDGLASENVVSIGRGA